jgi:hypothetical protein
MPRKSGGGYCILKTVMLYFGKAEEFFERSGFGAHFFIELE